MTKQTEALCMAIEAMELHGNQYPHMVKGYILDAIQACKEALAQPTAEQSSLVQEPMIIKQENGMVLKLGYDELPNGTAFYTTPPSREWVGLSDWDYVEIYGHANLVDWRVVRAIEAKLREKNNA